MSRIVMWHTCVIELCIKVGWRNNPMESNSVHCSVLPSAESSAAPVRNCWAFWCQHTVCPLYHIPDHGSPIAWIARNLRHIPRRWLHSWTRYYWEYCVRCALTVTGITARKNVTLWNIDWLNSQLKLHGTPETEFICESDVWFLANAITRHVRKVKIHHV